MHSGGRIKRSTAFSYIKLLILAAGCLIGITPGTPAWGGSDSRDAIERAVELIDSGNYALARAYLEPALIDPRLATTERSRAYYVRGYSFYAQDLFVSAGKDYYRALEFNPENPGAKAALASLHGRGLGVPQDYALAYELALQAAHAGHIGFDVEIDLAQLHARAPALAADDPVLGPRQHLGRARALHEGPGEGHARAADVDDQPLADVRRAACRLDRIATRFDGNKAQAVGTSTRVPSVDSVRSPSSRRP